LVRGEVMGKTLDGRGKVVAAEECLGAEDPGDGGGRKLALSTRGMAVFFLLLHLLTAGKVLAQLSVREILTRADESRGNLQGIEWVVSIVSSKESAASDMKFNVKARGFDIFAEALAPAKDKGNKLLMINGNMWFSKPGLSKAVPISRRQKLLGLASYGDIASTNYADDYEATPLPDEVHAGEDCYVFDLRARSSNATYDQIRYWVSKDRLVGVKADYYTVSGKLFKSSIMHYRNNLLIQGHYRPFISEIQIRDALTGGQVTTLLFADPVIKEIPDHVYDLNLLNR